MAALSCLAESSLAKILYFRNPRYFLAFCLIVWNHANTSPVSLRNLLNQVIFPATDECFVATQSRAATVALVVRGQHSALSVSKGLIIWGKLARSTGLARVSRDLCEQEMFMWEVATGLTSFALGVAPVVGEAGWEK